MKNKTILGFVILLLGLGIFGMYIFFQQKEKLVDNTTQKLLVGTTTNSQRSTPTPREVETPSEGTCYSDALITQVPVREQYDEVWSTYQNSQYSYTLSYPDTLCVYESGSDIFFERSGGGIGTIAISGTSTTQTLDAWLQDKKNEYKAQKLTISIDRTLQVAGYDAVSTHLHAEGELPYKDTPSSERSVYFVKDGTVFEIWTRGINQEYVLGHFTFNQ